MIDWLVKIRSIFDVVATMLNGLIQRSTSKQQQQMVIMISGSEKKCVHEKNNNKIRISGRAKKGELSSWQPGKKKSLKC